MQAKITKAEGWSIFRLGEVLYFPLGATVDGEVAKKAVEDRAANPLLPKSKKKAPENKATKPAENKERS